MHTRPEPGTVIAVPHRFSQADFDTFAAISGDDNPIHVDPAFAARTRFGHTVAHGMLLYTALRGHIARWFPDARQFDQQLMFPAPTYADEALCLELEVLTYPAPDRCDLALRVRRTQDDTVTLEGRTRLHLTGGSDETR